MRIFTKFMTLTTALTMVASPVMAADRGSSGRQAQTKKQMEIPRCTKRLGTVAIVEPDNQWWRELNLGSPEAIIKLFVQQSGCFGLVNRGRSMASRNLERAMADSGELQAGSNLGKGQVKAADYFIQPDIVTTNKNSGGNAIGGMLGGMLGGRIGGALLGGISVKKSEANVMLSVVNARTTEEEVMAEGYFRKSDLSFGGGGGLGWMGGLAAVGGGGYQSTDIGQVIVLAYLDAYTKMVTQMGGLPENAAAAAPLAK
ncbi:penicillin-binding protein activator LpoB [Sphingobium sp. KCTC 72723]|uniref:penicillin-binding protein activator LpoB n=1 Tax=Sphingobium sp. KCTC 72723 TaxID=2733867 RepID=UPI003977A586